jgi:hypothetical protein
MRGSGLLDHGLADAAGHGVEALADRLRQFRLARSEHFGDGAHAALHLGLRLQDAGHPRLGVARVIGGFRGSHGARLGRPPQRDHSARNRPRSSKTAKLKAWPSVMVVAPSWATGSERMDDRSFMGRA